MQGFGPDERSGEAELSAARLRIRRPPHPGPAPGSSQRRRVVRCLPSNKTRASRCRPSRPRPQRRISDRPRVETDRGIEHRLVDSLRVHVGEPSDRVVTTGLRLCEWLGTQMNPRRPSRGWRESPRGRRVSRLPATTTCSYPEASRVIRGLWCSGISAHASSGSTTCPSASTMVCGLVRALLMCGFALLT